METPGGPSSIRRTSTCRGSGRGSPSPCDTDGFSRSNREGSFIKAGLIDGKMSDEPRSTRASARSSATRAESLKSSFAGSTTAKYKLGLRNCSKELLSTITGGSSVASASIACWSAALRSGSPSARNPCFVRSQNERWAPAARKRALSVPVSARVSQLMAQTCSSGAQPQFSPFWAQTPWPYCVILPAIQLACGNAESTSHTSCVFPMLRVCPPTTTKRQRGAPFVSLAAKSSLKLFDARSQLRESGEPDVELLKFSERTGWRSPNGLAAANGFPAKHAALPANYRAILQFAALAKARLPAHNHVLPKHARSGQPCLCRNDCVRSDLTVVPHVD